MTVKHTPANNKETEFCPISTCKNFWNIENLRFESEGYITWKGRYVEHYNTDYASSPKSRDAAVDLAERCKFIEGRGKLVLTASVVWGWTLEGNESFYEERKRAVRVDFDNGDSVSTEINGNIESICKYYAFGKVFNLGSAEDRMAKVTSLEFI